MNKIGIDSILLAATILFASIYFAVRLAIIPLTNKPRKVIADEQDFGLVKLRDMGVLSPTELQEVIELHQKAGIKKRDYELYQKYEKVLNELKEMNYFSYNEYSIRTDKLKKHFKVK